MQLLRSGTVKTLYLTLVLALVSFIEVILAVLLYVQTRATFYYVEKPEFWFGEFIKEVYFSFCVIFMAGYIYKIAKELLVLCNNQPRSMESSDLWKYHGLAAGLLVFTLILMAVFPLQS